MENRILIMKPHDMLPDAFKHLAEVLPAPLSNVLVVEEQKKGHEMYLKVRFGKQDAVLNRRHFFTLGEKLIYLKRQKKKAAAKLAN